MTDYKQAFEDHLIERRFAKGELLKQVKVLLDTREVTETDKYRYATLFDAHQRDQMGLGRVILLVEDLKTRTLKAPDDWPYMPGVFRIEK